MKRDGREAFSPLAWLTPGPGPDERLGSVVDRAAALYGASTEDLLRELLGDAKPVWRDLDGCGSMPIFAISRTLGVQPSTLWSHRLPDHPRLLVPAARVSACPICWSEDRAAGRPHGFRRDWCGALRTTCSRHGVALELAGTFMRGFGPRQSRLQPIAPSEPCIRWLAAVDQFGRTLETALFDGGAWPTNWRLSPRRARSTLMAVSLNLGQDDAFPPASRMVCPSTLGSFARIPRHAISPIVGDPWTAFRSIADPALRRAALWLVAWWTCPELSEEWCPGWFTREVSDSLPMCAHATSRCVRSIVRDVMGSMPRTAVSWH